MRSMTDELNSGIPQNNSSYSLAPWTKKQGNKQMNKKTVFHVTDVCFWMKSVLWVMKVLKTRIAYPLNTEFDGVHGSNIKVTPATKRNKQVWNNVLNKNDRARENGRVTIELNGCYKLIPYFSSFVLWRRSKTIKCSLTTFHIPRFPHLSPATTSVLYLAGWNAIEKIRCGTSFATLPSLIFRRPKQFL